MKDQAALDRFFLEQGVDGLAVRASKGPTLSGEPLVRLSERLRMFRRALSKIERRARRAHRRRGAPRERARQERASASAKASRRRCRSSRRASRRSIPDIFPLTIDIGWETEHGAALARTSSRARARRAREVVIDWALVESAEYEELYSIEQDVRSIGPRRTSRSAPKALRRSRRGRRRGRAQARPSSRTPTRSGSSSMRAAARAGTSSATRVSAR